MVRTAVIGAALLTAIGTARVSPTRVTIDTGTIEGVVDSSSGVMVFRGIPYAAPPVGDLRWRPPQPPKHWTGVRPATQLGHNCIQHQPYGDIDPFTAGVSEDCLYLNVWTNSLPQSGSRLPPPASRLPANPHAPLAIPASVRVRAQYRA
jgi:para-nitrobenzyl esterase